MKKEVYKTSKHVIFVTAIRFLNFQRQPNFIIPPPTCSLINNFPFLDNCIVLKKGVGKNILCLFLPFNLPFSCPFPCFPFFLQGGKIVSQGNSSPDENHS